jgi:hypothetical protein
MMHRTKQGKVAGARTEQEGDLRPFTGASTSKSAASRDGSRSVEGGTRMCRPNPELGLIFEVPIATLRPL